MCVCMCVQGGVVTLSFTFLKGHCCRGTDFTHHLRRGRRERHSKQTSGVPTTIIFRKGARPGAVISFKKRIAWHGEISETPLPLDLFSPGPWFTA